MNITKKWVLATLLVGSIAGGALGGTVPSSAAGSAASTTSTGSTSMSSKSSSAAPSGTFVPNEDSSHDAGESAAREAQEDAGQFPTVP